MELTRAQILSKYDLQPKTLDFVLGSDFLEGRFKSKAGRRVISLSKADQFILESARNHITSFGCGSVVKGKVRGVHALPFHRFLILRFITTPLSEIYDELLQIDLVHSAGKFKRADLKKIYDRFMKRLPADLVKMVKAHRAPKTKKEKVNLITFLRVMNVRHFYEHPEALEDLGLFLSMKKQIEIFLSTNSQSDELAAFLTKKLTLRVKEIGVYSYRILFYSIHEINDEDIESYLMLVEPGERRLKRSVFNKTITDLAIESGMEGIAETRDFLEKIKLDAQKMYYNWWHLKTSEALSAQRQYLEQYLKADDWLEKKGGDTADLSRLFTKFVVKKAPRGVKSIEDIRGPKRAASGGE